MSRVIKCDRCGGEVDPKHIGYVSLLERKDGDELSGENPFEKMDFCPDCMQLIAEFITNETPKRTPRAPRGGSKREGTTVAPKRTRTNRDKLDTGKIFALHNAKWTDKMIAEEMGCSTVTISRILKEGSGKDD